MSVLQNHSAAREPPLPNRTVPFLWHYVTMRPWHFGGLMGLVIGAAGCAVAVQYGMKLLVDAMAGETRQASVWTPLLLFLGLIVLENILWRLAGWLGCRTVVASVVDIRVDLFRHLTGHPMRYFNEHFAGSLGNRISALGAAAGAIYGGLAWKIIPPVVDFLGAVVLLLTVDPRMALAGDLRGDRRGADHRLRHPGPIQAPALRRPGGAGGRRAGGRGVECLDYQGLRRAGPGKRTPGQRDRL